MSATMPDHAAPTPVLTYDGRIGDLYRIFLVNLLLMIVTLGVWRFWAVTRLRRYVWSRTGSGGQRFEYDGTGGQLFVGFLLAVLIIAGLALVAGAAAVLLRPLGHALAVLPFLLFELTVVVLALGAPFSAQRYRLSHTVWRGIRGGMQGSMIRYGLRSLLYGLFMVFTFYQLAPWAALRLFERRTNASFFGDHRFSAATSARAIYLRFLLTFLGVALLGVLVFGTFFATERHVFVGIVHAHDPRLVQLALNRMLPWLFLAYLVFGLGAALISAGYSAAFFRHITGHTTLGGLRFSSSVTGLSMLGLLLGNILILVSTLGFGLPIVIHRNAHFLADNLLGSGMLDLAQLHQSEQSVSRYGEGMFQALDAGAGIL